MFDQKLNRFSFDREKALEVLLYISTQIPDMYTTLKILYFADIEHLSKYGRFINGDTYIAMKHGPVPSQTYDIIKGVRGDALNAANELENSSLAIENNIIIPKRAANLSLISKSDIKCLDYSIETHKNQTFSELHNESSDAAYNSTDLNDEISVFEIAKTLPNSESIISYLEQKYS